MAARDPLSTSGRPVDVRQHGLEGAEGAGSLESSSTSVGAGLSLGSKRPSLVPYMDEPYADTGRR